MVGFSFHFIQAFASLLAPCTDNFIPGIQIFLLTVSAHLHLILNITLLIHTLHLLLSIEILLINRVKAISTCHKIKRLVTFGTAPRHSFITLIWRITFKIHAIIAYDITPIKPTLAFTNRSHTIIFKAKHSFTFNTEKVVELVGTFLALNILQGFTRELVTEREEGESTIGTFHIGVACLFELGVAVGVRAGNGCVLHLEVDRNYYRQYGST